MKVAKFFIIDFDSTFIQVEALDELCKISLQESALKDEILFQIEAITNRAMEGKLSFRKSLVQRLSLLDANKKDLDLLIETLKQKVSPSFVSNIDFFKKNADNIYIISNGFKEIITPIVAEFGIKVENVFANTFEFDETGKIIGFDKENDLSQEGGKVAVLKKMDLQGDIHVIGDGYNDFQIKKAGLANKFYAFTENIKRENVVAEADHETPNLEEFLYVNNMLSSFPFPKHKIKVLLLENIHQNAKTLLENEGYIVELLPAALDEEELCKKIKGVSMIGIRSKTKITKKVLEHADELMAIGAFCIGTNQINLDACLEYGIPVFNAPYSNTRSVVELALAEMIMLMRNIPDRSREMHEGVWNKSASNSFEVRGKKLGIIGYGNIGSQLSIIAEALGLEVHFYDVEDKLALGNAHYTASMEELLSKVDIVSLHVDGRPENELFFGEKEFDAMKDGAVFLNLARGFTIDVPVLAKHLKSGKIRGASVDVFPTEPKSNQEEFVSELRGLPNLILTPHIGGSTEEAQVSIAQFVPSKIKDYINTGNTFSSVNFPNLQLPKLKNAHRLIHTHQNKPGVLAKINNVLVKHNANILGQYLKTNENVGYIIIDIDKAYDKQLITALKTVDDTIRFRVVD
jgi:D-3-phosphoglycerate dehydrogenase